MGRHRGKALRVVMFAAMLVLAAGLAFLLTRPHSDRIVDCAPGYHNVAGPSSDCVPNQPPAASPGPK
jgi:hypothetical protein